MAGELETVTLADALRIGAWAARANVPLHWVGEPGIGKSAIAGTLARALGVDLVPLIASQRAPEDVGGMPVPPSAGARHVALLPVGPIGLAAERPCLLFLDEISQAPVHIQGALLTLINERYAGDVRLHPGTRILLASNPVSSGASAQELAPPFVNRIHTINVVPSVAEVCAYFDGIGADGSTLRALGADYSATLERSPNLLQLDAPQGARASEPWASPRAIERALRLWAEAIDAGEKADDLRVAKWCLSGSIGANAAGAYLAILRVRDRIATPAEILADPRKAKIPTDTDTGIASLGVVARVAEMDVACAWIYLSRLAPEYQQALSGKMMGKALDSRSPWAVEGGRERIRVAGARGATIARAAAPAPAPAKRGAK